MLFVVPHITDPYRGGMAHKTFQVIRTLRPITLRGVAKLDERHHHLHLLLLALGLEGGELACDLLDLHAEPELLRVEINEQALHSLVHVLDVVIDLFAVLEI